MGLSNSRCCAPKTHKMKLLLAAAVLKLEYHIGKGQYTQRNAFNPHNHAPFEASLRERKPYTYEHSPHPLTVDWTDFRGQPKENPHLLVRLAEFQNKRVLSL